MSPPNHLHLDPFCHPIPHNRPLLLAPPPPNYQHELIVALDGWHSARELPVTHHHPIIAVVEVSLSCRAESSCRSLPSSCCVVAVVPPIAIVLPRRHAIRCRCCAAWRPAAPCRRRSNSCRHHAAPCCHCASCRRAARCHCCAARCRRVLLVALLHLAVVVPPITVIVPPAAVIVPPVVMLPVAITVPPVAVVVPWQPNGRS